MNYQDKQLLELQDLMVMIKLNGGKVNTDTVMSLLHTGAMLYKPGLGVSPFHVRTVVQKVLDGVDYD